MDTKIEIEVKFSIPSQEVFYTLGTLKQLGNFLLRRPLTHHYKDTYFDTASWHLLKAGYACRQREREQDVLITLKSVHKAAGPVHKREEWEITLPAPQSPATWPDSKVQARIRRLSQGAPLLPQFTLQQHRTTRDIYDETRLIAELCLDDVTLQYPTHAQHYMEAEIELQAEGSETDLAKLISHMQDIPGLVLQRQSKFERALAALNLDTHGVLPYAE